MIKVEDKDPNAGETLSVSSFEYGEVTCNIRVDQATGTNGLLFHKDTWPALKAAVERTIQQMEAKPVIKTIEDRLTAARIIDECCHKTGSWASQSFGNKLLEALVRGYV